MTHDQLHAVSDLSERSNADLLSEYILITAQLREEHRRRRWLIDCRAAVRDTLIARLGLCIAMRFCGQVDGVMR